MAKSGLWPKTGMIVWEKKLKPSENMNQMAILPEYDIVSEFRIKYGYCNVYLPKHKSADLGGKMLDECYLSGKNTNGVIHLKISPTLILNAEAIRLYKDTVLTLVTITNELYSIKKSEDAENLSIFD
jgi:hypothetical protein